MPVALVVLAESPRFTDASSRVPAWQVLHAEADRLFPQLRTLWRSIFEDVRTHVDERALAAALARGDMLAVETLVRASWERYGDAPARAVMPVLVRSTVERVAESLLPATTRQLGARVDVQFNVVVPSTLDAINVFVGQQIVQISQTTLEAVRDVLRRGLTEALSLTQQLDELMQIVGLTPQQSRAIERLRERLTSEGRKASSIERQVESATRRALRLRAESIARTESITAAAMGQDQLWQQAAQQGLLDVTTFRRQWVVTPDDRLCETICAPIPSMNPGGRALREPFATPIGPIMYPAAHPMCRCAVSAIAA
jgi:hypothetical protein